jgi:hypothetical protein
VRSTVHGHSLRSATGVFDWQFGTPVPGVLPMTCPQMIDWKGTYSPLRKVPHLARPRNPSGPANMRRMCMNMFLSLLCSWGSPAMASTERVLVVSQHSAATKNASFAGMSPSATTGSGALVREPKLCWAQLPNLHCYSCSDMRTASIGTRGRSTGARPLAPCEDHRLPSQRNRGELHQLRDARADEAHCSRGPNQLEHKHVGHCGGKDPPQAGMGMVPKASLAQLRAVPSQPTCGVEPAQSRGHTHTHTHTHRLKRTTKTTGCPRSGRLCHVEGGKWWGQHELGE